MSEEHKPDWRRVKRNAAVKRETKADKAKRPPLPPPTIDGFIDIAKRSNKVEAMRVFWRNAKEMGLLTPELQEVLKQRAKEVEAGHV